MLEELELFLKRNPFFVQNDQIFWMYGTLLENQKNMVPAFIQYLKITILYPKSDLAKDAFNHIQELIKENTFLCLSEKQEELESYLNKKHFFENPIDGLLDIYHFIFSLNHQCFSEALLKDLNLFEEMCYNQPYPYDLLLYWKGSLQKRLKKFSLAYGNFQKLLNLFPESSLAPTALYECSMICYKNFKKYDQAHEGFVQLINNYPQDAHTALAQFYLSELFETGLDSLNEAINNYRLFLEEFPEHPLFPKAFKRLIILYFKTHRYEEAITLIGLNLNRVAQDSTFSAIIDSMAQVFEEKFKNYEFAARCYVMLAAEPALIAKAPFYLFQAARIYSKKLKDVEKAQQICERLKRNFPDSLFAKRCKMLLKQAIKK